MIFRGTVPIPTPVTFPKGPTVIGRLVAIPTTLTVSPGVYPMPGFCGVIVVIATCEGTPEVPLPDGG